MKIIRLQAENLKKLKAIDITPDEPLVKISGKNGAGKTSALDAILYALGGASTIPDAPLREGQKKGRVRLDLGDFKVEREFTHKGSRLSVKARDGSKYSSPQRHIESFTGSLSLDPLEFSRMPPARRSELLIELAGLDVSDLDEKLENAILERRDAGKLAKILAARVGDEPKDPPSKPIDIKATWRRLEEARAINSEIDENTRIRDHHRSRIQRFESEIEDERRLMQEAIRALDRLGDKILTSDIEDDVKNAEIVNARYNEIQQYAARKAEAEHAQDRHMEMEGRVDMIREKRAQAIANAHYPLPGLAVDEDGRVTYNNLPFEQASLSEQLRISTAVAMAMNPELKVIRITDGSLLDSDSMRILEEMASDQDYQIWIEIVDETGEVGFFIEEGEIVGEGEK